MDEDSNADEEDDEEDPKEKKRKKKRGGKSKKKRRVKKLLSTLFCCFRPHLCPHSAPRFRYMGYFCKVGVLNVQDPLHRILSTTLHGDEVGSKVAAENDSNPADSNAVFIGPMTLREYVATLEPYNPWLHGWRGEEPRLEWRGPPSVILPTPRAYRRHAH